MDNKALSELFTSCGKIISILEEEMDRVQAKLDDENGKIDRPSRLLMRSEISKYSDIIDLLWELTSHMTHIEQEGGENNAT